jgi:hypothetical protein
MGRKEGGKDGQTDGVERKERYEGSKEGILKGRKDY